MHFVTPSWPEDLGFQDRVQDVLDELVATGAENGLQVAVHQRGHRVVDAVNAGDADAAATAMRDHLTAARDRHLPYFETR